MSTKSQILSSIRRHQLPNVNIPSLEEDWITYADRQSQFVAMLESVGGKSVIVSTRANLNACLDSTPQFVSATKRCSLIDGIGEPTVDLSNVDDSHDLEDLDFAILPAQFGVAENGALWVTSEGIDHQATLFIVQHLALVVDADKIVDNMHQAYQRIALEKTRFGCFISGPSKTADIEQSLVIGAHGPRSLTVYLIDSDARD